MYHIYVLVMCQGFLDTLSASRSPCHVPKNVLVIDDILGDMVYKHNQKITITCCYYVWHIHITR